MDAHGHGAEDWDRFYADEEQGGRVWSGEPNGALVREVADLTPGTALDVGCGEGADAVWLARQGWRVTAVDPSRIALSRGQEAAREAGVEVTWVHAGLLGMSGGTDVHDLVSAQYPALPRTDDAAAVTALLGAVAPGGTLLVVHHEDFPEHADEHDGDHGFDPGDYLTPADIADHLDDGWEIEVHETRPRPEPAPPGTPDSDDVVLRARRRSGAGRVRPGGG